MRTFILVVRLNLIAAINQVQAGVIGILAPDQGFVDTCSACSP